MLQLRQDHGSWLEGRHPARSRHLAALKIIWEGLSGSTVHLGSLCGMAAPNAVRKHAVEPPHGTRFTSAHGKGLPQDQLHLSSPEH